MTNDMGDAVSDAVSDAAPSVDALDAAWSDPKLANVVYHDWEAATYDDKWSISYDERCIEYARDIFDRLVGDQMHLPAETTRDRRWYRILSAEPDAIRCGDVGDRDRHFPGNG